MNRELSDEQILLATIRGLPPGDERDRLMDELDLAPVDGRPFFARWLLIHEIEPFRDCWTDSGYDPSRFPAPRDVQILAATSYGKLDIENGGFWQFFHNHTGNFAPEMIEWAERAGLEKMAVIIQNASNVLGRDYPRSPEIRQQKMMELDTDHLWDSELFSSFDEPFFDLDDKEFNNAADRWLKSVCNVRRLRDRIVAQ